MNKKLLITFLFILSVILLTACGSDDSSSEADTSDDAEPTETTDDAAEEDDASETTESAGGVLGELQESGTAVVGFANEKPYAYEEDGELKGVAVDIARHILNELGIENIEGHLADFGQLIPGLNAKKFHIITAGMAINPDRCENAAFGEPEMMYGEGLVVQKGNPLNLKSYKDIAANPDATITIMAGATENEFVKIEGVDEGQIQSAPDIPATLSAVESGRADATTGTAMTLKEAMESLSSDNLELVMDFEQPDVEGVPSYGAAAFHFDSDDLREAYNEKLQELKDSGKILEYYEANGFPAELTEVPADVTTEKICSGEIS